VFPPPPNQYRRGIAKGVGIGSDVSRTTTFLFIDSDNTRLSRLAAGAASLCAPSESAVLSAGVSAGREVERAVIEAGRMTGFAVPDDQPRSVARLDQLSIDCVVTLDENSRRDCPLLGGSLAVIHWRIDDPGAGASLERLVETAREIRGRVEAFFAHGYADAIARQKKQFDDIMASLPVGVIAHDLKRKIVYFSPRAESITGFSQDEVIGRDCHEVFEPSLCGAQCSFCTDCESPEFKQLRYATALHTRDGQRRDVEMSLVPLMDGGTRPSGVLASIHDQTQLRTLERDTERTWSFSGIIGQDHKMQLIYDLIIDLANSDFPVVITGESGTGKELVARAIHNESNRRNNHFVPINCGALPEGTLESELFGHVKGAFTGAIRDKKGRFELADGGTLFLDEVAELSPKVQVKLLRVLQEGTFEPVGSEETRKVDVRIISATNGNLLEMIQDGTFREDVYYRLAVVPVEMPPLRERRNDIPLLANHYLRRVSEQLGREGMVMDDSTMSVLMSYAWPGNIRQLQNAIQFTMIKCHSRQIMPEHLPPEILGATGVGGFGGEQQREPGKVGRKPKLSIRDVEFALRKAGGNKAKAARMLGVGRATLYNFLTDHPETARAGEIE
jgi:PAS domain S-box-containing protein